MIMQILTLVAIFVCSAVAAKYFLKGKDVAAGYRKIMAKLSLKTAKYGLVRIPDVLSNIAAGDDATAIKEGIDLLKLFAESDTELFKELDRSFNSVLAAKLADPASRAAIQALVAEALNVASTAVKS